MLHIPLAAKQH